MKANKPNIYDFQIQENAFSIRFYLMELSTTGAVSIFTCCPGSIDRRRKCGRRRQRHLCCNLCKEYHS